MVSGSPETISNATAPDGAAVPYDDIGDGHVAESLDVRRTAGLSAQSGGYGRSGIEEVDVAAAPAAVTGCRTLSEAVPGARPASTPRVHLQDAAGPLLTQQGHQLLVAQAATRFDRVGCMHGPVVWFFVSERGGHGHLRHDGRAAPADEALVHQQDGRSTTRRGDGRVHARAACADDQDVGCNMRHRPCVPPLNMPAVLRWL